MRPSAIKVSPDGTVRDVWPTPVAGLFVLPVPELKVGCVRPSWIVVHARSGLFVWCCLRSPEAALAFVNELEPWDWTSNATEVQGDPARWRAVAEVGAKFGGYNGHRRTRPDYEQYADVNGGA